MAKTQMMRNAEPVTGRTEEELRRNGASRFNERNRAWLGMVLDRTGLAEIVRRRAVWRN